MVYRAQDLRHEIGAESTRVIAVKLLRDELRDDARAIERLKREFSHMQLLAHPNVLKVFDVDVDRGAWFMTMELLEGQSLSMYLRTHRASHPDALEIVKSCGEALQFAHERGIVHGDLKPGNIFLTSAGARVLDFIGAADVLRADRAATPAYASPQRLAGELPDVTDDIYSLGCVAYETLTGLHPFDRKPASVAHELGLQPARINSLSYRQWRALDRALAFDRRDRHGSMRAFLDALFLQEPKPEVAAAMAGQTPSLAAEGVIPVAAPIAVLTNPPADEQTAAGAVAAAKQVRSPEVLEPTFGLREREVLIQPLPDAAALVDAGLAPVFERPRRNVVVPAVIAVLLVLLAVYVARSDLDREAPLEPGTPAATATPTGDGVPESATPAATSAAVDATAADLANSSPVVPDTPRVADASTASSAKISSAATKSGALARNAPKAVGFETARVSVSERSVAAVIQVKRLGAAKAGRIPVRWRTEKRSATPGEDYEEVASGTLILQDGQRVGAIYVPIKDDDNSESDETFVVELQDSSKAVTPEIGLTIVTIRDDDRELLSSAQ